MFVRDELSDRRQRRQAVPLNLSAPSKSLAGRVVPHLLSNSLRPCAINLKASLVDTHSHYRELSQRTP